MIYSRNTTRQYFLNGWWNCFAMLGLVYFCWNHFLYDDSLIGPSIRTRILLLVAGMQFGWLNFGSHPNQDHPTVYGWSCKGSNKFQLAGKQTASAGSLWTGGSTSQWVRQPVAQRADGYANRRLSESVGTPTGGSASRWVRQPAA